MSSLVSSQVQWATLSMDFNTSANVRIACIAVATYDYILTLPAEWRIYRAPRGQYFIRTPALLFFLVRYISAILLISGSYTFWKGSEISYGACSRISRVPTTFKCLQAMVVQLIMGWRAYNISRRRESVLYFLTALYIATSVVQWVTSWYGRITSPSGGGCAVGNELGIQWVFYLCCVVWDVATLLVFLFYLSRIRTTSPLMTKLTRTMRVDGLVYFVAMTVINALNMLIYLNANGSIVQGLVVVAYTSAWILSQRILINLEDSALEKRDSTTNRTRTVTVSVSHSAEELGMEVVSRIRSAQEQSEPSPRHPGQRYRGRVQGTVQSTSGEFLDSVIEIDVGPRVPAKSHSDEANQSGPSRERHDHGEEDSLFDLTTDSGIGTNPNPLPRRNEGPLMTTRRF